MAKCKSITEMAEEIRDEILDNIEYNGITLRELCDKLKSNEYAPVVRCKECEDYNTTNCSKGFGWCERMDKGVSDDFYCANGAKMEDKA